MVTKKVIQTNMPLCLMWFKNIRRNPLHHNYLCSMQFLLRGGIRQMVVNLFIPYMKFITFMQWYKPSN
jgi:hypothetical protein